MTNTAIASVDISWQMGHCPARASFELLPGVTALIGPSGAGKTTLARILCGLQNSAQGTIQLFDHKLLNSAENFCLAPQQRKIGMVMQEPALFPTMTVRDNIELSNEADGNQLAQLLEITDTKQLLDRSPAALSGGEARRVAIVRAMAAKPQLLILDEPMNGLDPKRRRAVMTLIRTLAHTTNTPVLLITHQLEEMLFAADHALLMEGGHIVEEGSVETVLAAPKTSSLLGIDDAGTLLPATVESHEGHLLKADIGGDTLYVANDGEPIGARLRLRVLARDIALSLKPLADISVLNQLNAEIVSVKLGEHDNQIALKLVNSDGALNCRITKKSTAALKLEPGQKVIALIKAVAVKELLSEA